MPGNYIVLRADRAHKHNNARRSPRRIWPPTPKYALHTPPRLSPYHVHV